MGLRLGSDRWLYSVVVVFVAAGAVWCVCSARGAPRVFCCTPRLFSCTLVCAHQLRRPLYHGGWGRVRGWVRGRVRGRVRVRVSFQG